MLARRCLDSIGRLGGALVLVGTTLLHFISCGPANRPDERIRFRGLDLLLDRAPDVLAEADPDGRWQRLAEWAVRVGTYIPDPRAEAEPERGRLLLDERAARFVTDGARPHPASAPDSTPAGPPAQQPLGGDAGAPDTALDLPPPFGPEHRYTHLLYLAAFGLGLAVLAGPVRARGRVALAGLGLGALLWFLRRCADRLAALGLGMELQPGAVLALLGFGLAGVAGAAQWALEGARPTPHGPPMADVCHPESPEDRGFHPPAGRIKDPDPVQGRRCRSACLPPHGGRLPPGEPGRSRGTAPQPGASRILTQPKGAGAGVPAAPPWRTSATGRARKIAGGRTPARGIQDPDPVPRRWCRSACLPPHGGRLPPGEPGRSRGSRACPWRGATGSRAPGARRAGAAEALLHPPA